MWHALVLGTIGLCLSIVGEKKSDSPMNSGTCRGAQASTTTLRSGWSGIVASGSGREGADSSA
jgi:hypothetical protein